MNSYREAVCNEDPESIGHVGEICRYDVPSVDNHENVAKPVVAGSIDAGPPLPEPFLPTVLG